MDKFYMLICIVAIVIPVMFCNILFYIGTSLSNNYKRKQFANIKENGNYYRGIILTGGCQPKGYGRGRWLVKDAGEIVVEVNNKVYKIKDIDYNNEFKLLENSLDNHFNTKDLSTAKKTRVEIDIYIRQ